MSVQGYGAVEQLTIERILARYEESLGGSRQIDALSSLSIEGTLVDEGESYAFLLRKKRPGMIRYQLESGDFTVSCGFDGVVGWKYTSLQGKEMVEELEGPHVELLLEEASFDSPLVRYLEKSENQFTLMGNGDVEGMSAYVLLLTEEDGTQTRYYLSTRGSRLLKREKLNTSGAVVFDTIYRNYQIVDGYAFAHEVENRIEGRTVSLIKIGSIEVNPGLLSFYFSKPSVTQLAP